MVHILVIAIHIEMWQKSYPLNKWIIEKHITHKNIFPTNVKVKDIDLLIVQWMDLKKAFDGCFLPRRPELAQIWRINHQRTF